MTSLIGRKDEQDLMRSLLNSAQAEFLAIYGRRRVGKTFLVRQVYTKELIFQVTGIHGLGTRKQLINFYSALMQADAQIPPDTPPADWMQAFDMLKSFVTSKRQGVRVLFFDELPWMDTDGSGFMAALEHFWHAWASAQSRLILVVCGSAASWMINHLINNKGGLYNRITRRIRLVPFSLSETETFFTAHSIRLDRYQIVQLYMVLGGIPFYLEQIGPGKSAFQEIDRLCFTEGGLLRNEFMNLYRSLFDHPDKHLSIIEALAKKNKGLTREELIAETGLSNGGNTTRTIAELLESGFITATLPFGKKIKATLYRLTDPYSLFYLKFIRDARAGGAGSWIARLDSSSWRAWSGYAYENVCILHLTPIKKALGISGMYSEVSSWQSRSQGAQIDLLIDRRDHVITVCEVKFSADPFTVSKSYKKDLEHKLTAFRTETSTRKTVFLAMITTFGLQQNENSIGLVQNSLDMNDLFS